jgi:hypothetical protein
MRSQLITGGKLIILDVGVIFFGAKSLLHRYLNYETIHDLSCLSIKRLNNLNAVLQCSYTVCDCNGMESNALLVQVDV